MCVPRTERNAQDQAHIRTSLHPRSICIGEHSPEQFARFLNEDREAFAKIMQEANITPQ
jgi:hypothetical protein